MARFDRQIEMALRLIKKNGQAITWRQLIPVADNSQPWKVEENTQIDNEGIYICFLPVDKEMREFINYIRGTSVPIGSVVGLMGQVSFVPTIKDVVIRDGVEYRIKHIDLLSPNGQNILYTIEFNG